MLRVIIPLRKLDKVLLSNCADEKGCKSLENSGFNYSSRRSRFDVLVSCLKS